ncbi:GreA/GreB family elongation factor [Geothrix edaphica]|uniref:Elongation factor GreAB n=1 Tax=Geothrix edaphica TaxID=2927976 RepID=A0ABQ5PVZ8_9BACT|nr:GreA/GreB family elongation factor [Geothrix edaphica]GLH66493.1 elongation factor GreAB [Geothrix edaphica]
MNRAFIKDPDDTGRPEDLPDRPQSPHPNYVTPAGLRQLQDLKADLAGRQSRLLAEGKLANPQELAIVQRDLRYYQERLNRAVLVDPSGKTGERVHFGAAVEVCDEAGAIATYTLVGEDEADPAQGKVSWVSPLGEALLNAEAGDEVLWRRPAGTMRLEILSIRPGASC